MKSYKLPNVLRQEEDYEKLYDMPISELPDKSHDHIMDHFLDEKEAIFYREDVDFMRFHKRTTKNVHEALEDLLDSSKQTIYHGVKQKYKISINYVKLNRACSVVNAFWSINKLDPAGEQERNNVRNMPAEVQMQMKSMEYEARKGEIEKLKESMVK